MNGLLILVGVIILIGALNGFTKGAVKILVSLVATIATIAIVFFATPIVSSGIRALTPLDEMIEQRIQESFFKEGETEVEDYIEIPRKTQIALIEEAELPEVFKEVLLSNNNNEVYDLLGVHTFVDYIIEYLTKILIDIISFLITFVVVTIVVRVTMFMLDLMANLPVLGVLNRLSGTALGVVMSLVVVWILFTVIMLVYQTEFGKMLVQMIAENEFLRFLYNVNPIVKMMTMLR